MNRSNRVAHTAEHIFMRALSIIKKGSRVVKVEFKDDVNYIYVESPELSWKDVIKASEIANKVIRENRRVYIEYFNSLDEARRKYSDLRAYEERIKPPVRVVVIEGYDACACVGEHVEATGECIMFLPLTIKSAKKGRYIIEFLSGYRAVQEALKNANLIYTLTEILKCSRETILKTLKNLTSKYREYIRKYKGLLMEYLDGIKEYNVKNYKFKISYLKFGDKDTICEYAKTYIKDENSIFISFIEVDNKCLIILATDPKNQQVINEIKNCLFESFGGRGGGREGWIFGYVNNGFKAYKYLISNLKVIVTGFP